jgi:flavin-dependent dehydrogenase
LALLNDLGISAQQQTIREARIFAAESSFAAPLSPPAVSITRFDLDAALWRASMKRGVVCLSETSVQGLKEANPFRLRCQDQEFTARAVVDASGRWSNLSQRKLPLNGGTKWVGLKAHYAEENPAQSVDLYFFAEGYCGVQPIDTNTVNVCALVQSKATTKLEEVLGLNPELKRRSEQWRPITKQFSTAPIFFEAPEPVRRNVLCVGDAAGFIDPFVGDGITLALKSGGLAAEALAGFLRGELRLEDAAAQYARAYDEQLRPLFGRVAWVRKLLGLPRPMQRAAMNALRIPLLGQTLVRQTRTWTLD